MAYLLSFSAGLAIVVSVTLMGNAVWSKVKGVDPRWNFKATFLPALASGLLWGCARLYGRRPCAKTICCLFSIGNVASIYAVLGLGNTVGYPLTQVAMVGSALWGILYFKEMGGPSIPFFAVSTTILLGGAAMLSIFGSASS